jgi:homoserine kinase type II
MKTDSASGLRELLAKHYAIGELADYEQLFWGYVNLSYVVETVDGDKREKYFLRRYKDGVQVEEIEFEHSVVNHLVERGLGLVAQVLPTRDGRTYVERSDEQGNTFYAVFNLLPGEDRYTWVNPTCSDKELENAAVVLAQFHSAVADLTPKGRRYEPKIVDLLPEIAENVEACAKRAGRTEFDACFVENRVPILEAIASTLRAIRETECERVVHHVIHCDYHPGNLKFRNDRIVGLFDFDWSKVEARCFDVALALTYFCTAWEKERVGHLQLGKVAAFLRAYQNALRGAHEAGPLNSAELKCLPHMIGASNLYVLNWTIVDFYGKEVQLHEYLIYLQHGVHTMRWLGDRDNWESLERTIAESA